MSDYRGLGFDPSPGSADAIAAASRRCRRGVEVPAPPADWEGAAARAFAARLAELTEELQSAQRTLNAAAEELDDWAGTVLANQRRAEELDRRARELTTAIEDAENARVLASFTPGPDHATAQARLAELRREFDEVIAVARELEADHLSAARRVAEQLRLLMTGETTIPTRAEMFGPIATTLDDYSSLSSGLAGMLLGKPHDTTTASGGAAAFIAGLGDR